MNTSVYTTKEAVEAYLLEDIDESFVSNVERWISSVSRSMDAMANRKLVADEYNSEEDMEMRYFDVEKYGYLAIDDCVEIQKIEAKINDVWTEITDFETYPAQSPFRKIIYSFPIGIQTVRVRANWGYFETLPDDIQWAATVMVAGICIANQAVAGRNPGPVSREKIGNYEVTYGGGSDNAGKAAGFRDLEEAKQIVSNYRKILI